MIINWDNYADHIYCIHLESQTDRYIELVEEFKRINLLNSSNFELHKCIYHTDNLVYNALHEHIDIYNDAISHNYKKIIVCENDIRFLNDLSLLKLYLDNIPNDYDLILFDYIFGYSAEEIHRINTLRKDNSLYINFGTNNNVYSGACYLCNQKMMYHIIDNEKNIQKPIDNYTYYNNDSIDENIDKTLIRYVPNYNICIQKSFNNNLRKLVHNGIDNSYDRYKLQNIELSNYNL